MKKTAKIVQSFVFVVICFFASSLIVDAYTIPARAYSGLMGFCDFDENWQYTTWSDNAGKKYAFYEATDPGAKLPNCPETADNGKLYIFKGWSKGFRPGDSLNSAAACTSLISVGSVVEESQNYAPCYEMAPHVRLVANGGAIAENSTWSFMSGDMTYIATGSATSQTVVLPQVTFTGYHFKKESNQWRNTATGEIKNVGESVYLDGSIWIAVVNSTETKFDVFKTIGVGQVAKFGIEGMSSCKVTSGTSSYLSTEYSNGDCIVTGLRVTDFEQYADVIVSLQDGSTRTYKFTVEDKSGVNQNGSDAFIVDTSQNIVVGENDAMITDGIYTNQCNSFYVSNTNYKSSKVAFATSKKNNSQKIYSGAYHVEDSCGNNDDNNYLAFCLDPGRRGPGEMDGNGAYYGKTSDVNIETDFGKLIAYIVRNKQINNFDKFTDAGYSEANKQRVASHVAIRISAIKNGLSTAFDSADLVYATHYYPYAAVAEKLAALDDDGDVSEADAKTALNHKSASGNGFNWGTTASTNSNGNAYYDLEYNDYYNELVDILSNYDGSSGASVTNAGFSRTIDHTTVSELGAAGYTINYKGTITMPVGTTSASLTACKSSAGVQCVMNKFEYSAKTNSEGRRIYNYEVTINVFDASKLTVPQGESDEKELSFILDYNGSALVQSAFVANPLSGTDNLQRMLMITTSTPDVYVYFNVVPNKCDLPILNKDNCKDEAQCSANKFNGKLFVAAGCCRYVLDTTEYVYLHKNYCEPTCTSSTLSSACSYTTNGTGKADIYKIREGEKLVSSDSTVWEPNIGACVAQVSKKYVNDDATDVSKSGSFGDFVFEDDSKNIINVEAYKNNRYCQVTCKEDWEIAMDSFGNFTGKNAVAAGTYFQIISNDIFMSGTRTCYTTFINYDRFMDNLVDLSDNLVQKYNEYSEWSHVWTDLDGQSKDKIMVDGKEVYSDPASRAISNGTLNTISDGNVKCVEYFSECPDNTVNGTLLSSSDDNKYDYFYNSTELSKSCKSIDYSSKGTVTVNKCETPAAEDGGKAYSDVLGYEGKNLSNDGANKSDTKCLFTRTYCDDADAEHGQHETLNDDKTACVYSDYEPRTIVKKTVDSQASSSYPTWEWINLINGTCPTNYVPEEDERGSGKDMCHHKGGSRCANGTEYNGRCYSCPTGYTFNTTNEKCEKSVCPSGSELFDDGKCYSNTCPEIGGIQGKLSETYKKECYADRLTEVHTKKVESTPKYKYTALKCKTWGKVYDYSLSTRNNIEELNTIEKDVYYTTNTNNADYVNFSGDNYKVQNSIASTKNVKENYSKTFDYDCTLNAAPISLGGVGSYSCKEKGTLSDDGYKFESDVNSKVFCANKSYVTGNVCYAGGGESYTDKNNNAPQETYSATNNSNASAAFTYMLNTAMKEAKSTSSSARSSMTNYHSKIYFHAYDIFDCQHFQLHNNTDDMDGSKANNHISNGKIMGSSRSYVKISTEFKPTAAYEYGEKEFMTILGNDNILEQFTEKNDNVYGGTGSYANATNAKRPITLKTAYGEYDTYLYRNYIQTTYYNPSSLWVGNDSYSVKNYDDSTGKNSIDEMTTSSRKIIMCSVYDSDTTESSYTNGSNGEAIAFFASSSSPKWHGGRCYEVTVNYKNIHYVKSSISNSSYYKNKGYWYLNGADIKEHGNDFQDALNNANERSGGVNYDYSKEQGRWSRLGSFNVFPVSMGTPKNLYSYTYTFGQIGSYANGTLGRIMGTTKSIIKDNTRTCFYEIFEEVCGCCGYKVDNDPFINSWLEQCQKDDSCDYRYPQSNPANMGNGGGTLSLYINSVSLGSISGQNSTADNWTSNQKFMYNGYGNLVTEKGYQLKKLIESKGQTVYSSEPEYAYYLTPDVLRELRYYNDSVGYELNYNNLKMYQANAISCSTTECKDKIIDDYGPVTTFQHYGSKLLVGEDVKYQLNLKDYSYGSISPSNTKICKVDKNTLGDVNNLIENGNCRWVDYIESGQGYKNPATGETSRAFRLAFK